MQLTKASMEARVSELASKASARAISMLLKWPGRGQRLSAETTEAATSTDRPRSNPGTFSPQTVLKAFSAASL